jgi:hypothetical protein
MDEFNSGMEPEIRQYFRKILNSFSVGAMWMLSFSTLGLFFGLAHIDEGIRWYNIVFYSVFVLSFAALIFYFYRLWRKKAPGKDPLP